MNNFTIIKNKKGFTLIELLVTIAILAIIAGVGVDMFATVIRAYRKAEVFSLLERNGSQVLTQIEQDVRSSISAEVSNNGNTLVVFIPQGAATIQKQYTFESCSGGNSGNITVTDNSNTASLINNEDENIINEQVYIKKIDSGDDFVRKAFNNVYISFIVASGSCDTSEVEVFQQVSVNLRGGLE